ncbi:hypothetical protein NIA69_20905 [Gemmiger formicilis]|nr:hypothetical protein [Gemmiger formicilis]
MVNTQLKILRVFGPTGAEVSSVLRGIRDDGCPGLRLLERDGEFAICVQVSAPNRAMAEQYCDKWAARLRAKFGDDVFAEGRPAWPRPRWTRCWKNASCWLPWTSRRAACWAAFAAAAPQRGRL